MVLENRAVSASVRVREVEFTEKGKYFMAEVPNGSCVKSPQLLQTSSATQSRIS